jgi:hypothetical protein
MFCPEGYTPFSTLVEIAGKNFSFEAAKYQKSKFRSVLLLTVERPDDVILGWLVDFCEQHLFLSDGMCRPINVDTWLITEDRFHVDLSYRIFRYEHDIEFPSDLARKFEFCNPITDTEIDIFNEHFDAYKDADSPHDFDQNKKVCDEMIDAHLDDKRRTVPFLFINHETYTISLELYRFLLTLDVEAQSSVLNDEAHDKAILLEKFEGMALCVPSSFVDKNWGTFWVNKGQREIDRWDEFGCEIIDTTTSRRGRPSLRKAQQAFAAMGYDKGDLSWGQLQQKIAIQTGERPSPKTFRDWIKKENKG